MAALAALVTADCMDTQRAEMKNMLNKILGESDNALGCLKSVEHAIDVADAKPIKQRGDAVSKKSVEQIHALEMR